MLRMGTLKCPMDKAVLHFALIGTMRVKHRIEGKWQYAARCPECKNHYAVKAPKE